MKIRTSFELSKKLYEGGCRLVENNKLLEEIVEDDPHYYCFDILNDICCEYAKEFFGEHQIPILSCDTTTSEMDFAYLIHTRKVLELKQQGKKEEAEEYIWEHCVFNPKNKEKE